MIFRSVKGNSTRNLSWICDVFSAESSADENHLLFQQSFRPLKTLYAHRKKHIG